VKILVPERYRKMREAAGLDSVSLGYSSVILTPVAELDEAQAGYGVVPKGQKTDWHPEWVAIGFEGLCGDPVFIDTKEDDYPVYTAAHGEGSWEPRLIAASFDQFVQILRRLEGLARGRETPKKLEANPIPAKEWDAFLRFIRQGSPQADLGFWSGLR
jgi:hypothetical protein